MMGLNLLIVFANHRLSTQPQWLRQGLTPDNSCYKPVVGTTFRDPPQVTAVESKPFIDA
jgi:hypothetical protein